MTLKEIAKSYATALFLVAEERFKIGEYKDSLALLAVVFEKNPGYIEMLTSPMIPISKRLDAIDRAFGGFLPREVAYFLRLICQNGDIDKVRFIVDEYISLYNKSKKIKTAKVKSAQSLTPKQIQKLVKALEKITDSKVILEISEDKEIIGGIKVELDEKVFDGSLKRRFDLLKEIVNR